MKIEIGEDGWQASRVGREGIYLLEVPAVQVERDCAEVFREKRACIAINEESEFGPLGKYL